MVKTTEPSTAHPIVDPSGPGLGRLQLLPHVTPVNVDLLRAELASHPDRVFVSSLINDMSYGARICYTGLRSSPFLFNCLAEALAFIAYHNFHIKDLLHYLDDYFLIQPSSSLSKASTTFSTLLSVFTGLEIPLAEGDDKICPPPPPIHRSNIFGDWI